MSSQILSATEPAKTTIYKTLDAWRGFAALWVVMVHITVPIVVQYPDIARKPLYAFSLWGALGVPIFFVISGYCIANAAVRSRSQANPLSYFFWHRIRRLYPPYFFASCITVFFSTCLSALVGYHILPNSSLAKIDFFHHDIWYYFSVMTLTQIPLGQPLILTVFWTLCYELAFYVIVALFLQATRLAENTNLLFQSLNIFTILCLVWLIISPTNCPFPLNLWPQFGFGILVFNLIFQPKHHKPKIFLAISIVLMLLYGTLYSYGAKLGQPSSQIQSYFSVIYTILLLWLYQFDEKLILTPYIRPLASIGMFSYSLYLTHLITLGTLSQLGRKLGFSLEILFCLQIVSSLLVAYIFFRLFERPFLKTNSFNRRIAKSLEKS